MLFPRRRERTERRKAEDEWSVQVSTGEFPKIMHWTGVIPAITTALLEDGGVDHPFLARHGRWLVENGCAGVGALGSLGESATLRFEEKVAVPLADGGR